MSAGSVSNSFSAISHFWSPRRTTMVAASAPSRVTKIRSGRQGLQRFHPPAGAKHPAGPHGEELHRAAGGCERLSHSRALATALGIDPGQRPDDVDEGLLVG